ncbi:potassium transporter [Marinilongibacter aquaticus]|uniref:ion channel n=1 Tax=Marinilongibacter aquaticus TaxID=2975157 RepID=UPI0021BD8B01|nr:ion channel [Marinilongibacter aquaticus]UBM59899.1 potassium transporter [Marinilongibacter aquaticus]
MAESQKRKWNLVEKEHNREDSGFGTKATSKKARMLESDGRFNVKKMHQSFDAYWNVYHRLIELHWLKFGVLIFSFYFLINMVFAELYVAIGLQHLEGISISNGISPYWQAFFFSTQTMTTVGYGTISPDGYLTNFVAAFEALFGLMSFALMTGLLYGRFSRPSPKIRWSENALIAPYFDINGLMFRVANERSNQVFDVQVRIMFTRNELEDGELIRRYYSLDLERERVKYLATSWTIVHPITKDSVLFGETEESLRESDGEFLISIEGTNDTMSDPIHTRKSYLYNELVWGAKFVSAIDVEGSRYVLDLGKIGEYVPAQLNK